MARLPQPGGDKGNWGDILNDYLSASHNSDGSLKDIPQTKITNLTSDLSAKANLASPTFTGTVTVPTPSTPTDAVTKSYVDAQVSAGMVDATATTKGKIQLAGDLAGTAASPSVPGLANKLDTTTAASTYLTQNNATSTYAPKASPTFTGVVTVPTPNNGTDAATKSYVDSTVSSGAPDATASVKGKIQLAGDLTGTAGAPVIAAGAITSAKIADGTIVDGDINSSAAISQSKIANLTSDLAAKATPALVDSKIATQAASDSAMYIAQANAAIVATTGAYSDLTGKPTIPSSPGQVGAEPVGLSISTSRSLTQRASAGALQVIAIGDSRTMGDSAHPNGALFNANSGQGGQDPVTGLYPVTGPYEYRQGPRSWFQHMCWQSKGRLRPLFNAAQGSDTTRGMLARFPADVVAKNPDLVLIGDSHNDGFTDTETRANITAMVDLALAAGIRVALYSALPSDNLGKGIVLRRYNTWLKSFAQSRHLAFIDLWPAVIDIADGTYLASMTNDGTHLTYSGAAAAGAKALSDLSGILAGGSDWLPVDNTSDVNMITNPIFSAGGLWYTSGGTATGAFETDPVNYFGKAWAVTITVAGTLLRQDVGLTKASPGDRLKWVGLVRVENAAANGMRWSLEISSPGISTYYVRPVEMTATGMDMPWFYYECEYVVPAGATTLRLGVNTQTGTGKVSLAQQGLYNLTRLAVASS